MTPVRALLIDLDDTLYDERDYVLSGFRAVAEEAARRFPRIEPGALHADMVAVLDAEGRGRVFDRALARAGIEPDGGLVAALVETYRQHRPAIGLWPGVERALAGLAERCRLAVVTDGLHAMQARKVEALGVADRVGAVVYCWEHAAPKPDPRGYHEALARLGARPQEAVVIGDNPLHDMAAAAALGCRSIRVRTGRFGALDHQGFPPDAEAPDFVAAAALLAGGFGDTP